MSLRSAYSTIFQPVLQDGSPFQGQINAAIPGNVAIGDSTTAYTLSINSQTITSASGNLNISGNISATGSLTVSAATVSNALNVSGITTVSALSVQNYLNVSGLSSLSNVNICGAVNITGNTFLNSNLEVKRSLSAESVYSTTLSGVININGAPYVAGGNPFNWSTLPAISDVNMSGYSISGVSNLTVSNNVSINGSTTINSGLSAESVYATTLSGITLINGAPYVPGVNPANWSTYPAVTNLSMGGFNIGNINAVSISGRLVVDGSATFNGVTRLSNADVSGLLSVSGGNVQNKWNVSGQLNAENASIVANLGVSGDAIISNAYVTALYGGTTTLSSLNVQSNVSISGETLLVGKVTVSDVLNVSGLTTISGLTVQNDLSVGGIVYATNLSAVSFINGISFNAAGIPSNWASYGAVGDVDVSGNDIYNVDNLNVSGLSVFAGGVSIPALSTISAASITGSLSSSNVFVSNALNVSGLTTLSGMIVQNLLSGNNISITNDLSAQDAYISNVLNVSGLATLSGATVQNKLGVGASVVTPSALLHVYSNGTTTAGAATLFVTNNYVGLNSTGSDSTEAIVAIGSMYGGTPYYTSLQAKVNPSAYGDEVRLDICTPLTANNNTQQPRMTLLANSGNVGIAVTNPSTALDISGQLRIADFNDGGIINFGRNGPSSFGRRGYVYHDATNMEINNQQSNGSLSFWSSNAERMTILSNGNVGIAITDPSTALDISGQLRVAGFQDGGIINFGRNGASTFGRRGYVYHDATNMLINNQQSNGSLSFWSSNTERITILSNGAVGIATTTPNSGYGILDVNSANVRFGISNTALINLCRTGNTDTNRRGYIYHDGTNMEINNQENGHLLVSTNNSEKMRILSTGNVGINCNAPGYKLDVNGTINCTNLQTANPTVGPFWSYRRQSTQAQGGQDTNQSPSGTTDGTFIAWDTLVYQSTSALTVSPTANPTDYAATYWTAPRAGYYKVAFSIRTVKQLVLGKNNVPVTETSSGVSQVDLLAINSGTLTCILYINTNDTLNIAVAFGEGSGNVFSGMWHIEFLRA